VQPSPFAIGGVRHSLDTEADAHALILATNWASACDRQRLCAVHDGQSADCHFRLL